VKATLACPLRMTPTSMSEPTVMSANDAHPSFWLKTRAFSRMLDANTIAATSKKTGQRINAATPWPVSAA